MTRSADMPSARAELAAFSARLESIFARGRKEARNANPVVREYLRMRDEANAAGCTLDEQIGWKLARIKPRETAGPVGEVVRGRAA